MKMQMKTKTTRKRNKDDEGMQKNEDKYEEEYTENHMILRNVLPQKLFPSNVVCRIV